MQNVKPISELRNYSKLLKEVTPGEPVYLTKNGYLRYVLLTIEDYEKSMRHVQHQRNKSKIAPDEKTEKPSISKADDKVQPVPSSGDNGSSSHSINSNAKHRTRLPIGEIIIPSMRK